MASDFIYLQENEKVLPPLAGMLLVRSVLPACNWRRSDPEFLSCGMFVSCTCNSFYSAWALTHLFLESPVLSFQPVLGGLKGMFWAIVMYQGPALGEWVGGLFTDALPCFSTPLWSTAEIIMDSALIMSSGPATNHPHAMTHHLIRPGTLLQKSWSRSPGQAGLHVSASLSLLPWDTASLVI